MKDSNEGLEQKDWNEEMKKRRTGMKDCNEGLE